MANIVAVRTLTHHGDEVICEETSHIVQYETAAHAAVSGVQLRMLRGDRGRLTPGQVRDAIRAQDIHHPNSRLVSIENTHNRGGGSVYPVDTVAGIARVARERGLAVHMDGARLLNACIAAGVEPPAYTQHADLCTLCFSKGLGAPIGSIVAGDAGPIEQARRFRKMLGGGMRQVGVIAAAALYALDHHVDRLAEDHANARFLAEALAEMPGIGIDPKAVETNLLIFEVTAAGLTAADLVAAMKEQGVLFLAIAPQECRMVTHLDVSREQIEQVVPQLRSCLIGCG